MRSKERTIDEEPELFLVQGRLSEIHVERDRENLLQRIDRHYKGKAVVTGAGAIVGDMFGQAASAASLAMYDGEDTQNFACLIDDQVMCGQFGGAEWLFEQHTVKAVVSKQADVLVAHAVIDETAGTLWIGHPWGSRAESLANWKIALWCFIFGVFCFVLAGLILGTGSRTLFEVFITGVAAGGVICFGMAIWNNHTMQALAEPSTEMFRLLGFASPESVNLNRYRISQFYTQDDKYKELNDLPIPELSSSAYQTKDTYYYKRAIHDGKLSMVVVQE
jgi:hypothetical protein